MAVKITERLRLDDGIRRFSRVPDSPNQLRVEGAAHFTFHLFRKQTEMGRVPVDQFWMRTHGLYGERNQRSRNRQVVIAYFWARCHKHLDIMNKSVQESYILAGLLPHARSNGSRRVFADASLARTKKAEMDKQSMADELEHMLRASRSEEITEMQFRDQTADLLGPPQYQREVWYRYREFVSEITGEGRRILEAEGERGLTVAKNGWCDKMRKIGRRAGNNIEKIVLDILSYEARAAFHRCYSVVWLDLMEHLANKYNLSKESVVFHKLWHLDIKTEAEETDDAHFHLFHGSIFGLHPACGNFMLTRTGPALIGEWLDEPKCVSKYQRVLHGLIVAMHQYALRNNLYAELRKKQPESCGEGGIQAVQEKQVEKKQGRRRPGRRDSDAT